MKYRKFTKILTDHGFKKIRQESSHRQYEGYHGGKRRMVTVAYRSLNDDILPKTLASMIRQSGLRKKTFR